MLRNNKHPSAQRISLSPLIGGINVSQPPEQIAENEMQECQNFIFERDSQRLVGRGGLKLISSFDSKIKGMWYDVDNNCTFVFLENRDCYKVVLADTESSREYLDKVTGKGVPQCCKFQNMLFVASGEHLQYYDYSTQDNYLQSITDSPVCDNLFYRWGRLMVTQSGTDRITYSSVGDASSDMAWVENMNDDSSSKWLDVGEKDGGDIQEVVPLSTDIMIFKSNGKVYQFTGDSELDTWALYNVANFTDLTGNFTANMCAENIGEEVVFLSLRGLKTLSTTQDYGNISATDIGSKFNKLLTRNLYEPCMYHMRRRMTLLIRPTSDKKYFVAYNYGLNAATTLKFAMDVEYVLETKDDVFVACGSNIYKWDDAATTDAGEPIEYKLMPRSIIGTDDLLLKSIDTKFASDHAGTATVSVGDRLKVKMPTNGRRKVKCNHSDDLMVLKVESTSRFEVDHIIVEGVGL